MKAWQKNSLIVAAVLVLDQMTKYLAMNGDILFESRFLSFTLVKNTGASFGLLQGLNEYLIWFYVIALGVLAYHYPDLSQEAKLPFLLIIAGLLGNFVDRITLGYVVDFVNLHFWPVFNVADSAIVIGVFCIIWLEVSKNR